MDSQKGERYGWDRQRARAMCRKEGRVDNGEGYG